MCIRDSVHAVLPQQFFYLLRIQRAVGKLVGKHRAPDGAPPLSVGEEKVSVGAQQRGHRGIQACLFGLLDVPKAVEGDDCIKGLWGGKVHKIPHEKGRVGQLTRQRRLDHPLRTVDA